MKSANVLVLGAGLISPPLVRYLLGRTRHRVTVAALDTRRIEAVLSQYPRGRAAQLDIGDRAALERLVREADAVVSLLPAELNAGVAELAVAQRIPLVNTSYVSRELGELDSAARNAGVLLLAEMGLDPGIDHMTAVREVRRVAALGGRVDRLLSCAGGLPVADASANPWGYKFSWSPRAVMLAARRPARFRRAGREVALPAERLFEHHWPYAVDPRGVFELYPNRDSLRYEAAYGLSGLDGIFRGTLRYPGWCETMRAVVALGMLELEEREWPAGTTYGDFASRRVAPGPGSLVERVAAHLGVEASAEVVARLEWAGLLSDRPLPLRRAAPLDVLVGRLGGLMRYRLGERDLVVLESVLDASFPDRHAEELKLTLIAEGEPFGDSAMARCASLPAAIATRLLLEERIEAVGVQIPVLPEIYVPVLVELEELGLRSVEQRRTRYPGPLAEPEA